jgi:transcriptional regulator of heat shock response
MPLNCAYPKTLKQALNFTNMSSATIRIISSLTAAILKVLIFTVHSLLQVSTRTLSEMIILAAGFLELSVERAQVIHSHFLLMQMSHSDASCTTELGDFENRGERRWTF